MAAFRNKNCLSQSMPLYIILIWMVILRFSTTVKAEDEAEIELSNIKKLKDTLFKGYDLNTRPVTHHTNTTTVDFNIYPAYILDLIEDSSLFMLDGWLVLFWYDYRLVWNESEHGGITHLQLPNHAVWQPDITVYNGYSGNIDAFLNTHLLLYSNGLILSFPPAVLDTVCHIHTEGSYPDDKITCQIEFGSWSHNGWQIDLHIHGEQMPLEEFENSNPRWELLFDEVKIVRNVKQYGEAEGLYITITAYFPMKRRPPPELQVIWAPCVLVMAMMLLMFWIPPNSCKKIILGGFLFASLCLLIVYVAYITKSSRFVKRAVTFLESTLYAVASAIIAEVLVINLCAVTGPCRPPEALVGILSNPSAKYLFVHTSWEARKPGDKMQFKEGENHQVILHPTPNEEWILVATGLDRLLFFIYVIILSAIHQI